MKDQKSQEVIIQGFNAMRNDQKQIASKTTELQVCVIVNWFSHLSVLHRFSKISTNTTSSLRLWKVLMLTESASGLYSITSYNVTLTSIFTWRLFPEWLVGSSWRELWRKSCQLLWVTGERERASLSTFLLLALTETRWENSSRALTSSSPRKGRRSTPTWRNTIFNLEINREGKKTKEKETRKTQSLEEFLWQTRRSTQCLRSSFLIMFLFSMITHLWEFQNSSLLSVQGSLLQIRLMTSASASLEEWKMEREEWRK